MLACRCQGNKYHLDCKRDPHVVSSIFEVFHICKALAKEKNEIFCVSLRQLKELVKYILLDSQKCERSAPFKKKYQYFI